ncbi:MAG: sensor histidine kinase [Clostridia bacterium]
MSISKLINNVRKSIFHSSDDKVSPEDKIAAFCIIFSLVNSFMLIFFNRAILDNYSLFLVSFLLLLITFGSTVLMFFKINLNLLANISLGSLGAIYLPLTWFYSGGIYGVSPMIMFMLIIFNAILNTGLWRSIVSIVQLAIAVILLIYSHSNPESIIESGQSLYGEFGIILNILYIFIATTAVIFYFADQNREAVKKVEEANDRLKNANSEVFEAARTQRELISNLSHDLNTPITLISGYASALSEGLVTKENQKKYLELIEKKSIDLSNLIDDLIELSNLETTQIKLKIVEYNIHSLIEEVYHRFKDEVVEKGLKFDIKELDNKLSYKNVLIDRKQINKVFSNLIYNSLKHTNEGFITIRVKTNNDFAIIEVEDSGKGISEEQLPFVFDRFYKGSISRNSEKSGSGLGLHISKKIVSLHNGEIWAKSDENSGATFVFTIPLAKN